VFNETRAGMVTGDTENLTANLRESSKLSQFGHTATSSAGISIA